MHSNIVHQYFKKETAESKILMKVNPLHLSGIELVVNNKGLVSSRDMELDEAIFEELEREGFREVNALEFNLYLSGLVR
jgi:hypothetical protein